ncbi:MAG: magnesium-translocating P-type ATPase, partial [Paraprevotella sp.]|nr:magnesium-translocating P-type ATPase [Paraprevotella sp.]
MWRKKLFKAQLAFNAEKICYVAKQPSEAVYKYFETSSIGLGEEEVRKRQALYGENKIVHEKKKRSVIMLANAFINPFVGILTMLVVVTLILDVCFAQPGDENL